MNFLKITKTIAILIGLVLSLPLMAQQELSSNQQDNIPYDSLRIVLEEVLENDQNIRGELMGLFDSLGYSSQSPLILDAWSRMRKIDSINLVIVEDVLDKYGWMPKSKLGETAAEALFYVIQHSNLSTMEKHFPAFKSLADIGEASKTDAAKMEDRILMNQGKKQIYGTQAAGLRLDRTKAIWPIKDPDKVNELRKAIGFEMTVEENAKRLKAAYDPNEKLPYQYTEPILLDKSFLSGVGLKKITLQDEPDKIFHQSQLFRGLDISIYVVSTETWDNHFDDFSFDEFIHIYQGEANVIPKNGDVQTFQTGDYFFAPKGFKGDWNINAGEHLHYELSVISSQRVESSDNVKPLTHQLIDPNKLSGAQIKLDATGEYEEVLVEGVELTIRLKAEKPTTDQKITIPNDQMIRLLSGQISIVDIDENTHTFYTGDFFVLPNDFSGVWTSQGHGLIKYLLVEKTVED